MKCTVSIPSLIVIALAGISASFLSAFWSMQWPPSRHRLLFASDRGGGSSANRVDPDVRSDNFDLSSLARPSFTPLGS
jgi:hypothetical protein